MAPDPLSGCGIRVGGWTRAIGSSNPPEPFGAEERIWMSVSRQDKQQAAGWYPSGVHGRRYWDGGEWTDHVAYAPPSSRIDLFGLFIAVFLAVAFGVFVGLMILRLLADANPDAFFVPIKVVVQQTTSTTPFP
jgi:hypothetical protein